jgi:carbon monoxide dehydrogenase subunit G
MIIEGQFKLQAPIQKVWDSLLDPKTLGSCVPGTEMMEAIDKETYESVVKQRVGPFKIKLKFTTKLTEVRPPNYIKAVGRGADVTKLGNFSSEIEVKLTETAPNNVDVSYTANISLVGRLATFGERVMRAKAKEVGEEFTKNLQEKLGAGQTAGA